MKYVENNPLDPVQYNALVEFVRDPEPLHDSATDFLCPADAENGPSPRDVEDGAEAFAWAERTRSHLALALVIGMTTEHHLDEADLELLLHAVESHKHPYIASKQGALSLRSILYTMRSDAYRRADEQTETDHRAGRHAGENGDGACPLCCGRGDDIPCGPCVPSLTVGAVLADKKTS